MRNPTNAIVHATESFPGDDRTPQQVEFDRQLRTAMSNGGNSRFSSRWVAGLRGKMEARDNQLHDRRRMEQLFDVQGRVGPGQQLIEDLYDEKLEQRAHREHPVLITYSSERGGRTSDRMKQEVQDGGNNDQHDA